MVAMILIHNIHSLAQTFQDVLAVLGFFQLIRRAAADDLELEVQIALHHGLQAHDLGHAVIQRQHDYTHGVLQLGVAVELVQHYLRVGVLLDLDQDLHAGAAGGQVVQSLMPSMRLSLTRSPMDSSRRVLLTM